MYQSLFTALPGNRPPGQKTSPSNADTCVSLWDRRLVLILPRYCHAANEAFHSLSAKAATTAQARAEKQVQLKDASLAQEKKPSLHRQRWSKEFEWVIQDLSEAYDVEWKYGDPTARKRILIVGLRRDIFEPKGIKWQWPREVCDQTFYLSLYVGTSPSKTKTSPSRTGSTETTQSGLGHTRRGR